MKLNDLKVKNPAPNFARKATATPSPQERPIRPRASRKLYKTFKKNKTNLAGLWQNWYGARILILGLGREGKDNFRFLRKIFPEKNLGVGDRNENVKCQKD